jgi:hypothetical protein
VLKLNSDRNGMTLLEGAREQNAKKNISGLQRRIKKKEWRISHKVERKSLYTPLNIIGE